MNILIESGTCRMEKVRLMEGGKTLGVVLLIVWPHFKTHRRTDGDEIGISDEHYATVQDNGVIEALQDQGHGQAMMDRLIERAKELGVSRITLTASEKREAAAHVYLKKGFEPTTVGYTLRLKPKKEGTT